MFSCIPLHIRHSSWGFSLFYLNTAFPEHFTAIKTMDSTNIWKFTAMKLKNVYLTHLYTVWRGSYCNNSQKLKVTNDFYGKAIMVQSTMQWRHNWMQRYSLVNISLDTRCTCAWHHALSTHSTVFNGDAHNLHYKTVTASMV
jgi:hypothetical protein